MSKTLEQVVAMGPEKVAHYATNEARKSPKLRAQMRSAWETLQSDLVAAVLNAQATGQPLPAWQVQEKVRAARIGLLCAIVLGHPEEALDAARRAAGLVLLGDDGEPL